MESEVTSTAKIMCKNLVILNYINLNQQQFVDTFCVTRSSSQHHFPLRLMTASEDNGRGREAFVSGLHPYTTAQLAEAHKRGQESHLSPL